MARIAGVDELFFERLGSQLIGWPDPVQRLRAAIEKDEFELYCQPILALQDAERFPMAEVLVRLREEEKALLPPGEFLPVFEHYHMMPQLDRWVVRTTVRRLASGSRIPRFTVNVSGQTLADRQFAAFVAGELATSGLPPERLLFEIDESDALLHAPAAQEFARECRALGCGVLLDGFGRRSVSFQPVRDLGVHFVKVDGSVTRHLLTSDMSDGKMRAILRVGEVLKFGVVAECVEEQDVVLRLKALGCGYAQGFGIYQPQPLDRLAAPG